MPESKTIVRIIGFHPVVFGCCPNHFWKSELIVGVRSNPHHLVHKAAVSTLALAEHTRGGSPDTLVATHPASPQFPFSTCSMTWSRTRSMTLSSTRSKTPSAGASLGS